MAYQGAERAVVLAPISRMEASGLQSSALSEGKTSRLRTSISSQCSMTVYSRATSGPKLPPAIVPVVSIDFCNWILES
jgi:hypothetical protein